jgi:paraquat-inducible protein B
MTDPSPPPQATIRQGRRFSFSYGWIAPVIAAVAGAYLFYKSEIDVGPTITIVFENGTDISKGAKVEYRGVQVGAVQSVELDVSLGHVNVEAQLDKTATGLAREGSQFWVVEPEVSLGEITGLNTLLSGSYIQVDPGSGDEATHFVGLPAPPVVTAGETDLALILEADDAGSLQVDTPILYRGIEVGAVSAIDLQGERVRIDVAIDSKRAGLVQTNSIFWRTSGIQANLSPLDPTIDISSLASLVRGGISFATPQGPGDAASANAMFQLFDDPPDKLEIEPPQDGLKLVLTAAQAGIAENAPVYYRELPVGKVLQSRLNQDASGIEIEVLIEPQHASLVHTNSVFWNVSGVQIDLDLTDPKIDIESLKALLAGGIAFSSQGAAGKPVENGATFTLHDRQPTDGAGEAAGGRRFILVADELGSVAVGDPIYYRQVQVGKVGETELIPDGTAVAISVLIDEEQASLVRERSVFWNASGIHANLSLLDPSIDVESAKALLSGGIAFATPADGGGGPAAADAEFRLLSEEEGKKWTQPAAEGLHVVLSADELGSVAVGDPVYYREVEVGEVTAVGFQNGASSVLVHAVVRQRYAPLVQEGSVFWNASGLRTKFGLFSGASIDVESLKALFAGGVAFATPDIQGGSQAADGSHFVLHDKPEDEWLAWRPTVRLGPAEAGPPLPRIEMAAVGGFSVEDLSPNTYVATTASHVRQGPGTTYRVIRTLQPEESVEVTGKAVGVDWYRISMANDEVGYVWARLLQPGGAPAAQ